VNVRTRDEAKSRPVHIAVEHNAVAALKLLISFNADVNALDGTQSTALHLASRRNCEECLLTLLAAGVKVIVRGLMQMRFRLIGVW
jgi:ankyrin repeat protein